MTGGTPDTADSDPELQAVLDALDDPDCRTILHHLDRPMTAHELMDACDLPQTTTYRKLNRLEEASLIEEDLEVREDGHHTTRYTRAFAGVLIGLYGDDLFDVSLLRSPETADERLTRFWTAMREELW